MTNNLIKRELINQVAAKLSENDVKLNKKQIDGNHKSLKRLSQRSLRTQSVTLTASVLLNFATVKSAKT